MMWVCTNYIGFIIIQGRGCNCTNPCINMFRAKHYISIYDFLGF